MRSAAMRIDDPRVSEAHAMVSLRDGELQLLALRGVLAVHRARQSEIVLVPGLSIRLAKDLSLDVISVELEPTALGIAIDGGPSQLLLGSAASVVLDPEPGLVKAYRRDAAAWLWSDAEGWQIQVPGSAPEPFVAGLVLNVEGHSLTAEQVPIQRAGVEATAMGGRLHPPLRIVANYDTAHIHRKGLEPLTLSGISARILGELVALGGPATWDVVAKQVWRSDEPLERLRHRWDVSLGRLRSKLEQHGVRRTLIHSDGAGQIELVLLADDVLEDNT
jgi:hypothetical protein